MSGVSGFSRNTVHAVNRGATLHNLTQSLNSCGPRFLREVHNSCDWTHRGAGPWSGKNSRLPEQMAYPRRAQFNSHKKRALWTDLTRAEQEQFEILGWTRLSWGNRRFGQARQGDTVTA